MVHERPTALNTTILKAGILCLGALIFGFDRMIPLGVAVELLYILQVLMTLPLRQARFTILTGFLAGGLTYLGLLYSPEGGEYWHVLVNRIISVGAIGVTTMLVLHQIKTWQSLLAHEERMDLALHATDEGIWDWLDTSKEEEWWSPKFFSLLDYSPDEMTPSISRFKTLVHPEDQESTFTAFDKHLKDQAPFDIEYRLQTKSGDYRWFRGRATSVQSAPNGPIRMVGSIDDISTRKMTESALTEQNHLLSFDAEVGRILNQERDLQPLLQQCTQAVVDHVHAAFARIWTLNPNNDILELQASAGLYTHLDGPHSRIPVGQFKIGQIAAEKKPHLTNSVVGDARVSDQEWAKREGMVAFAGFPLLKGQDVVGVLALFAKQPLTALTIKMLEMVSDRITDTIELIQTRQAHQELYQHNQRILDSAGDGIYGLNLEGVTTFVNPAGARMLGYQPEELIGLPMHSTVHHTKPDGTPYPREHCPMYAAFTDGSIHSVEDEVLWRKDGTSFPVSYTSTPARNHHGQITAAVVLFQDVTTRKHTEQKLAEYTRELEISNQELDDFAYITSHDLKEPLRGIANYTRFLVEDHGALLSKEGQAQCDTIIKLTQRMENLIESLRYYSRLGRTDLNLTPVDLNAMVTDIAFTLKPRLEETRTTLRQPQPLPVWPCDGTRFQEALANLITNAMKYNDKSDKWIEITAQTLHNPKRLEIAVQDNGIGIAEQHHTQIFRIFRRLHGRDKFGGGDGAGLTIVKKIMERHGGSIHLQSTVGDGTTFFLTLPFATSTTHENATTCP